MTIERAWVRVFLSTPARMLATVGGLFALIVVVPIVFAILGLPLVALLVLLLGLAGAAALVLALLPRGGRRY